MLRAWAVILALLTVLGTTPQRWGAAQAREYVVWMNLPTTGIDSLQECYDTIPGPPIHRLEALEAWAVSFDPADRDTLRAWIGIEGMEGDSIGVAWEFPDSMGVMGLMQYRVRNNVGWSCYHSFVFASHP